MIILGIDPALGSLGWGVICEESNKFKYISSGIIKTSPTQLMHKRLAIITTELERIINHFKPDLVSMEETFVNSNAVSSLKLGYVRGAIMALVGKSELEYIEFKPNLIKKTIVGMGHADKAQVMHMIKIMVLESAHVTSFDESDALAIAYTGNVYFKVKERDLKYQLTANQK
ncbi:MAG: crossover junction endodeoxyribonuclease RuvC [Rickettsiaceae bacterium]|nr:MAG: crossover junction endodeoxyribonuclease RuvC [Rickettsiaceae bacterium]